MRTIVLKRGFLFGVGCFFLFAALGGFLPGSESSFRDDLVQLEPAAVAMEAFFVFAGISAIYIARHAAPHTTWMRAIFGWILGCAAALVATFPIMGIIALLSRS
jgi:hypothetical protein